MIPAYLCHVCHRQIPSARAHYVTEYGQVLCTSCVEDTTNHDLVHPGCVVTVPHSVLDHPVTAGTRSGAYRALMRLFAAEGFAG